MGWPVQVVDVTGSTNADLVASARAGDRGPRVLAARSQSAGRGRLGRSWRSPSGASLAVSVLWAPAASQARWTWLPMVVGLGVLDGLGRLGVDACLKWPNDVVAPVPPLTSAAPGTSAAPVTSAVPGAAGPDAGAPAGALAGLAKLAGVLVDVAPGPGGPLVVAGVGVNLRAPGDDVSARATSVAELAGRAGRAVPGFDDVLAALVDGLRGRLEAWDAAGGDAGASGVREDYRRVCTTLGRTVRVTAPGRTHAGEVVDVDPDGALELRTPSGTERVSAGDVEHVR